MKKILLFAVLAFLFLCVPVFAATGDITAIRIVDNTAVDGQLSFITGSVTTGTFTAGETITQDTTGATGIINNAPTGSANMNIYSLSGSPNATDVWKHGADAYTPSAAPAAMPNSGLNGWVAEIDITQGSGHPLKNGTYAALVLGNNIPTAAAPVFTVTSMGYDTSGNATTITRTVYGIKPLRAIWHRETLYSETDAGAGTLTIRIALSDYIYAKDKSGGGNSGTDVTCAIAAGLYTEGGQASNAYSGAVTNNSTVAYPKVIGHFAIEQRRPVNGTHNIEVFAVHKYGQNNKPLASVVVTATGATSTHSHTGTATEMTLSARGDKIPVYSVPLDISVSGGFTRGELVNINFTAYPWVGDSTSVLDATTDAQTYVNQLWPLKWTVMDKMIAVVDPTAPGNDTTCVASATQATADAAKCATIGGALTKIAAANNSAYSLNRVDGGEVQLMAGTYTMIAKGAQTVTNGYFTITNHASTDQAGVVFIESSVKYTYLYERLYNMTINRANNGYIFYGTSASVLVLEKINFADNKTGWYSGDASTDLETFDSTTNNSAFMQGGNDGHSRIVRNSSFGTVGYGQPSCVLGNSGRLAYYPLTGGISNIVLAYNKATSIGDGFFTCYIPVTNVAIVNNVVERTGDSATPISEVSSNTVTNFLLMYNSYVGQRFNHENDWGTPHNYVFTDYVGKFNNFDSRGDHRADIRTPGNVTLTGTWSVGYSVGWIGNHNEAISYSGDQDFYGLYSNVDTGTESFPSIVPNAPVGYLRNYSRTGTNAGNGDYNLLSTSVPIHYVPSGKAVLPFDLLGHPRRNDGTGAAGAYEYRGKVGGIDSAYKVGGVAYPASIGGVY